MISNFKYKCPPPRAEDVELYNSEYGGGVRGCETMCTPESAPLPLYYQFYFGNEKKCIYLCYNEPNLRKLFQFSNLRNNQNYEK